MTAKQFARERVTAVDVELYRHVFRVDVERPRWLTASPFLERAMTTRQGDRDTVILLILLRTQVKQKLDRAPGDPV